MMLTFVNQLNQSGTMNRSNSRSQLGMTLLEIMIVLTIIAVVMGTLVGPKVMGMFSDSKLKTTQLMVDQIANEAYSHWSLSAEKECPESFSELDKYRNSKSVKDGWGQDVLMLCGESAPEGVAFGVLSKGPDKKQGTEDDIKSWKD